MALSATKRSLLQIDIPKSYELEESFKSTQAGAIFRKDVGCRLQPLLEVNSFAWVCQGLF